MVMFLLNIYESFRNVGLLMYNRCLDKYGRMEAFRFNRARLFSQAIDSIVLYGYVYFLRRDFIFMLTSILFKSIKWKCFYWQ